MVAATLALVACASANDPSDVASLSLTGGDHGRAVVSDSAMNASPSDPLTIDSVHVAGDSLFATVTHGGGCGQHTYRLVVSSAWMESFPIQARARISHDAGEDHCKALIGRNLRISLAPIADAYRSAYRQQHGTVDLLLAGTNTLLRYVF